MLIHYFITGLKPVGIHIPLPMKTDEFLRRAHDALSGPVLDDLIRLASIKEIMESVRAYNSFSHELLWSYWQMIKTESSSPFLGKLADAALDLYATVSLIMSDENAAKTELLFLGEQDFFALNRHPDLAALKEARLHDDPMVLEEAIAHAFFRAMDELSDLDTFAQTQVFLYFQKLLICERLQSFDISKGQLILRKLLEPAVERALHARPYSNI